MMMMSPLLLQRCRGVVKKTTSVGGLCQSFASCGFWWMVFFTTSAYGWQCGSRNGTDDNSNGTDALLDLDSPSLPACSSSCSLNGDMPASLLSWDLNATFGLTFPCASDGTSSGTPGPFLLLVYGYAVYQASLLLANALDQLQAHGGASVAKLIGSCISPTVGALPDAILIMVTAKSQEDVDAGIAMLVGSNALLLTVPFFIATFVGRRAFVQDDTSNKLTADYESELPASDRFSCSKESLFRRGVSLYPEVTEQAQLMVISLLPLVVIQTGLFLGDACDSATQRTLQVAALIISFLLLLGILYESYADAFNKSAEYREYRKDRNAWRAGVKIALAANFVESSSTDQIQKALGGLARRRGSVDVLNAIAKKTSFVKEASNKSASAFSEAIVAFDPSSIGDEESGKLMRTGRARSEGAFDVMTGVTIEMPSTNKRRALTERQHRATGPAAQRPSLRRSLTRRFPLTLQEKKHLRQRAWHLMTASVPDAQIKFIFDSWRYFAENHSFTKLFEENLLKEQLTQSRTLFGWNLEILDACFKIVASLLLVSLFADPLVTVLLTQACEWGIPKVVASMLVPLLTSGEVVSAYVFSREKRRGTTSMSFSSIFAAVSLNNSLVLFAFLMMLVSNDLEWRFEGESVAMLFLCVLIGVFALKRGGVLGGESYSENLHATYSCFDAICVLAMYPLTAVVAESAGGKAAEPAFFTLAAPWVIIILFLIFRGGVINVAKKVHRATTKRLFQKKVGSSSRAYECFSFFRRMCMSREQIKEEERRAQIAQEFRYFDKDGSGGLNAEELRAAFESLHLDIPENQIVAILKAVDTDRSGQIDLEEFEALFTFAKGEAATGGGMLHPSVMEERRIVDSAFDLFAGAAIGEADDTISFTDLKAVAQRLGIEISDIELKHMLKDADNDGDGTITRKEFRQILRVMNLVG